MRGFLRDSFSTKEDGDDSLRVPTLAATPAARSSDYARLSIWISLLAPREPPAGAAPRVAA